MMNSEIIDIIQQILKKDNLEFVFAEKGSCSNYYVDSSLSFGVKVFLEKFIPRDGIKDVTNKMYSLGISNKIYEVSNEFRFILMEHLNGYQKISDSKIIKNPNQQDKIYLKKVLQHWIKMSENSISHFDIYSENVLVNRSTGDVKLIDFDEYKIGNKYVLMEYLKDYTFGDLLLHSLLQGEESLPELKEKNFKNLLSKREEIFKEFIVKDKCLLGRTTIKNKILKLSESTVDSTLKEILTDIKNCFIDF